MKDQGETDGALRMNQIKLFLALLEDLLLMGFISIVNFIFNSKYKTTADHNLDLRCALVTFRVYSTLMYLINVPYYGREGAGRTNTNFRSSFILSPMIPHIIYGPY